MRARRGAAPQSSGERERWEGKPLIVFLEAGAGIWFPNNVAKQVPDPLLFATVWVVGLRSFADSEYVYSVTNLDLTEQCANAAGATIRHCYPVW